MGTLSAGIFPEGALITSTKNYAKKLSIYIKGLKARRGQVSLGNAHGSFFIVIAILL
jgi:hypothetical protein